MKYIYTLARSGNIRYVGSSANPKDRLRRHMNSAKANENKAYRLRLNEWLVQGPVELDIVEKVLNDENVYEREWWWITTLRSQGHDLFNTILT